MSRSRPVRTAAAALLAIALVVGAGACAPRQNAASFAPITESSLVDRLPAATKDVGNVTWAVVEGEPQTLDPTNTTNVITPNVCAGLLRLNADYSVSPGLATRADWVDPVTFRIDLRPGLRFSDGTRLTAADVVYSFRRNLAESSQWYTTFVLVRSIEARGDGEVLVHFKAPDSSFRNSLTGGAGEVLSKAHGARAGKSLGTADGGLLCAGPYRIEKWVPGTEIDVAANPYYWAGEPRAKHISFKFVSDANTLTNALTSGEIDGAFNVSPSSRAALESSGTGRLYVGHSTTSYSFGAMTDKGAAANPEIRQALSLAIDRQKYIDAVLQGLGYEQKTIVPPFTFVHDAARGTLQAGYDALPAQRVDLKRARRLVAESGVDVSRPLVLAVQAGATEMSRTALIIQDAAKQIGLTVQIDEMQAADFGALFYSTDPSSNGVDLVATNGYIEVPDYLGYPTQFVLSPDQGGYFNWSGYDNKKASSLMTAARTATTPRQEAADFVAAQKIFTPDDLQVTLAGAYQLTYLSNRLTGPITSAAVYSAPWAAGLGAK